MKSMKWCGRVVRGCVVMMSLWGVFAQAGDGTWTNVVGGVWSDAGNWAGGSVPDNGHANLTLTGNSYSVDYNSEGSAISNLVVRNSAGNTTALNLSAPLAHVGGAITLSTGAVVTASSGSLWIYGGTIPNNTDTLLDVSRGGVLEVNGGAVQFTNVQRSVASAWNAPTFQIGNASTGTLRVTSGVFNGSTLNKSANDSHEMYVGNGTGGYGSLEIATGASVVLGRGDNNNTLLYVGREGGRGSVLVAGDLIFTNKSEPRIGTVFSTHGSYGEMVVTNAGRLITGPGTGSGKPKVGVHGNCYGVLRLSGTNYMSGGSFGWEGLFAGQCENVNGTSTGLVQQTAGSIRVWGNVNIGLAQGSGKAAVGTLEISGGLATFHTAYNTWIGAAGAGGKAQGTLSVSGGALLISNGANANVLVYPPGVAPNWGYSMAGLIVGQTGKGTGNLDDDNPSSTASGTLYLSGGSITNKHQLVVGCNGATGSVYQTGGHYVHEPTTTDTDNMMTLIGYSYGTGSNPRGGVGSYEISDGTFTTPRRVFVGGVPTSVQWFARGGAEGHLKVTGGTFTCNNTLFLGENGTGTVTMGSGGALTVDNLVATNATSTLRFELGANGIGTFKVNNALTVSSATRLEVDMALFKDAGTIKLLDCGTRSGMIDESNITVTGGSGVVVQTIDANLYLQVVRGTVILVR